MHSECRKMHHFASRFDKISRGDTPNPLWNGTQTVTEPLGNFPLKSNSFSSKFSEQMRSECRKMHHFAFRFGKFSRGGTPNPLWGGTQGATVAYQGRPL